MTYVCPRCGMKSYHPVDVQEKWCGKCCMFEDECDDECERIDEVQSKR